MAALIVLTTASSQKQARQLASILLKSRLAACVQISGAIESHFVWKGKREKTREFQIWIKTTSAAFKKIENAIRNHHSYEVPEILALPVSKGNSAYLKWLKTEVRV